MSEPKPGYFEIDPKTLALQRLIRGGTPALDPALEADLEEELVPWATKKIGAFRAPEFGELLLNKGGVKLQTAEIVRPPYTVEYLSASITLERVAPGEHEVVINAFGAFPSTPEPNKYKAGKTSEEGFAEWQEKARGRYPESEGNTWKFAAIPTARQSQSERVRNRSMAGIILLRRLQRGRPQYDIPKRTHEFFGSKKLENTDFENDLSLAFRFQKETLALTRLLVAEQLTDANRAIVEKFVDAITPNPLKLFIP